MNNIKSSLISRSTKTLSPALKRQLDYMNPKGASNRKLPYTAQRMQLDNSGFTQKSTDLLSPAKLPQIFRPVQNHSTLTKSTKTLKALLLITSQESSPIKDMPRSTSHSNLDQISGIMSSCEAISKINKSDKLTADFLEKQNKLVFDDAADFIRQQTLKTEVSRWTYRFNKRKLDKRSIEKIKKESFETAYYVEKVLNKDNSAKKIKERIMPWKKIILYH